MHYDQIPLSKLRGEEGKWGWNDQFDVQRAMRFWGVWPPSKWYEASIEDRSYALVSYQEEMKILAYQAKLDRIKQEADALNRDRSGRD